MDISDISNTKNKLIESLLSKDSVTFKKCIQEALDATEKMLVEKYSKDIKDQLNA